jgi:ASPIC and UnbV
MTSGGTRRTICRTIGSGSSLGGNPYEATIGLGSSTVIESLEVYWPASGARQLLRDVSADQPVIIIEGSQRLIPAGLTPVATFE